MKILIIDSHKGGKNITDNLHLLNANLLAKSIKADLIWSYEGVNDEIKSGYDVIIFNHASQYSFVDYAWLEANPNARLFYITNEYNLDEPRILWMGIKRGNRSYSVIANHPAAASKIVKKYTTDWNIVNLNCLIFNPEFKTNEDKKGTIYYGSFRADRSKYFSKYLNENIMVSTHKKNISKFTDVGVTSQFVDRIKWKKDGLNQYTSSLYIEDEVTHTHYNHLANRFYEALNWNVVPIFAAECENTINNCGYLIPKEIIFDSQERLKIVSDMLENHKDKTHRLLASYRRKAQMEKEDTINKIKTIIGL
jgi:hypothetical protein